MNKWPKQHLKLLFSAIFLSAVFIAAYFVLIYPLQNKVAEDNLFIQETKTKLQKSGWPLDPGRLAGILQMKKSELEAEKKKETEDTTSGGLKFTSSRTLKYCTNPLKQRMKKIFDNPSDFTRDATRLDFREEYNQIEEKLASKGVFLSDQLLKLGEKNISKEIYLMLLQIWTLDKISSIAINSGLRIQTESTVAAEDETGRKRAAAKIQFEPIIDYRLSKESNTSYVFEIPLKIALFGNSRSFIKFLSSLQNEENFFPVRKIQIFNIPELRQTDTEFWLNAGNLLVEIECSAFFSPHDSDSPKMQKPEQVKVIPVGA